jgi:hypothetical protein
MASIATMTRSRRRPTSAPISWSGNKNRGAKTRDRGYSIKRDRGCAKKRAGRKPCSENCVDPITPQNSDLILIDGATLLVRARVPPETWTTKLSLSASLNLPDKAWLWLCHHFKQRLIEIRATCQKSGI